MGHGAQQERTPTASLDAASAATVATTLQALATQSRLLMLTRLRQGACTVGELAEAVEMEQSAVSFYSKTQDEPIFLVNQTKFYLNYADHEFDCRVKGYPHQIG